MSLNKKGLTMIEIVVSVGILGIIAVLFLTAFSGQFAMFSRTGKLTDDLFQSQEIIEQDIERIKADLAQGTGAISNQHISYNLFAGTTYARQVSGYVSDTKLHSAEPQLVTVVSDGRLPDFPVPSVIDANLRIVRNGTAATSLLDNYENVSLPGLSLRATSTIDENGVYYTSRHEWYVSNPGFNIPVISRNNPNYESLVSSDYDHGRLYPLFPNDYSPVPVSAYSGNTTESILSTLSETYAGRHIIYQVTPFAVSGRKGESVFSDPVFLSGPSVREGRILHLDASLISKADFGTANSALFASNSTKVKRWQDQSGLNNHAVQNTESLMPDVEEVNYHDSMSLWGKAISGSSGGSELSIASFNTSGALTEYTVAVVAKRLTNESHDILIARNGSDTVWAIGYDDLDLVFDSSASGGIPAIRNLAVDDSWHILLFDFKSDGTVEVYLDDETSPSAVGTIATGYTINSMNINLSDNYELAEILMYRGLSAANKTKVRDFLNNKYQPDPAEHAVTISYLLPVADQVIIKGDTIAGLPGSVPAHMSNGSIQNVAIAWDGSFNSSTVGTYSITGRAVMNNTKTVSAVIHVLGIDQLQLSPSNVNIIQGTDYPLPVRLPAQVSNTQLSRVMDVLVNWFDVSAGLPGNSLNNLSVLSASASAYTIRAYAGLDNAISADLSVSVDAHTPVTGVSLNKNSSTVNLNSSDTLVATVHPTNATYKDISWLSSNSAVVSITNTATPGTVQINAISGGNAVITVTTAEGGFTATCNVTVHVPLTELSFPQGTVSMSRNSTQNALNWLTFTPANATNKNVTWHSSNTNIATVTSSGIVSTRNTNGRTNITARSVENNAIFAEFEIQVSGNSGC